MNLRAIPALALAAALLMGGVSASASAREPDLSCKAGVLMDADSGRLLWQRLPDEPMAIASTTKIMTALTALEQCGLDDEVTVDPAWTGVEGSSMYLAPGQTLTVEQLLYGLMLASGNDAAVALACTAAGSVEDFAALMNDAAQRLGCANTHFVNPNGLDEPGHYASARDLALITRAALADGDLRRIVSPRPYKIGERTFVNHNRLLWECEGVFGVKTGYTSAAGRTLVTACEREGVTLICVTLSDPDDWDDHRDLYDWAYDLYDRSDVLAGRAWSVPVMGGEQPEVRVTAPEGLWVLHRGGEPIRVEYRLPAFLYAEVAAGQVCGEAAAFLNGVEVARTALVCAEDVAQTQEEPSVWDKLLALLG